MDSQTEEALVASKVDFLSEEYNQLLVSQLNQQRAYFEDRLQQQAEEIEMLKSQAQDLNRQCESACEQARSSDRARHAVEQKMVRLSKHFAPENSFIDILDERPCRKEEI